MITNKEYLTHSLSSLMIASAKIDFLLKKFGLNPDDECDYKAIDSLLYENVRFIMPMVNSVSEGGTSISYGGDEAFKRWYSMLCHSIGKENIFASKISDSADLW